MHNRRDILLSGIVGAALFGLGLSKAEAEALASLDIFVPAAPGGGWDQTGRAIEAAMRTDGLVSEFRFEHAPGAGGMAGLPKFVNGKKGQGNAILVGGMVMVGAGIANKSPVTITDVTPIARLTGEPEVIVVPAESTFRTLADLVAQLKKDPKSVSWAGGSAGGTDHIFAGMVAKFAGVDPRMIAYIAYAGGGPAQAALLGNQVSAGVSGFGEFEEQIKAGKLRAIAISSETASRGVPSLREQGVDVVLYNWRGVFGAPGITPAQRDALVALFAKMAQGPTWKATLATKGWDGILLTGDEFGAFVKRDIANVTLMLQTLGLAT